MAEPERLVAEEVAATLDRAGFETLSPDSVRVEVTDSLRRRLGDCRPVRGADGDPDGERYRIRIARRLFEGDHDTEWRDTVRHELAHAYVFSTVGRDARPHGEEWQAAARQAGANPTARYEGDALVDEDYILACPDGCYERGYLKRSKRIKFPWKYACPECGTPLVSYDAADVPAALEPGTCDVASITWSRPRIVNACPEGCFSAGHLQHTEQTRNPDRYRCGDCHSPTVTYPAGERPVDPTPGTDYTG